MDRFVIKPVFARPTKRYQLVGDPIPPPANRLHHRPKRQKDQDLPSAWDQSPIARTNNVQMMDHVPVRTDHIIARADYPPLPDQAQRYAVCPLDNFNSELAVRG
jgi:hypothetical protein